MAQVYREDIKFVKTAFYSILYFTNRDKQTHSNSREQKTAFEYEQDTTNCIYTVHI